MSCNAYIVEYDKNKEPILGKNMQYNIVERPNVENLKKLTLLLLMSKYLKEDIIMKVR